MPDWINSLLWLIVGVFIGAVVTATIVCCMIKKGDIEDEQ